MKIRVVIMLAVLTAFFLSGCNREEPVEEVNTTTIPVETPIEVDVTLPKMSEVKAEQQPLLYDFVFGCLDWHVSIHRDIIDSDLYIIRNLKAPGVLYTDWYPIQSGYSVPPLGSEIETVTLTAREVDNFNAVVTELPEDYILHEGDWELIIYAGDAARLLRQCGFSFRGQYKYTDSRVPPFIVTGSGWPTDWLRREPYLTALQNAGIDMNDAWWDKFNYRAEYKLLDDSGTMTPEGYYVICTGVREFTFCDGEGTKSQGMTWDNLMYTCNTLECNLGDLYHHGDIEFVARE